MRVFQIVNVTLLSLIPVFRGRAVRKLTLLFTYSLASDMAIFVNKKSLINKVEGAHFQCMARPRGCRCQAGCSCCLKHRKLC